MAEYNDYLLKTITDQDHQQILAHLEKNFYIDEPVNAMLGSSTDRVADQNMRYTDMLQRYPNSIYATPKTSANEMDSAEGQKDAVDIAAVLIVHIHDINNPLPARTPRSPITSNFLQFVTQMESKFNVFEQYKLSEFPELTILSVDRNHRGKGLATALYKNAVSQLFDEGFPLVYTELSNPISRKVAQKCGFQEVARFYFKEFDGNKEHANAIVDAADEEFVSQMIIERNNYYQK